MFAEVIVDINNNNVNQNYYYKIPEKFINIDLIGYRVDVPFGNRLVQGYVVNTLENVEFDKSKCKEIKNIKDNFSVLTKEQILLVNLISEEFYCNKIQAIEIMIPTILKNKYVEYYELNLEKDILFDYSKYFSKKKFILKNTLEKKISKDEIAYLLKEKIIKLVTLTQDQLQNNREEYIVLSNYNNEKLSKKQSLLIEYLLDNNCILKKEIKNKLNVGSSVVNKLLEKNIIKIEFRDINFNIETNEYNNENILSFEQKTVLENIINSKGVGKFEEFLLHGVTGSGKTEIYIQLTKHYISKNKSVILLVPEIILTSQIVEKFKNVFGENIAILHSRLNKSEKYKEWKKIKDNKVQICIGTRSAIFAPFDNLGLIIIDEEHESTYKQTDTPRYNAKYIAKKRAIYNKAKLLYASATPSIELYYNFDKFNKKNLLFLTNRYNNKLPKIDIVELENKEKLINDKLLKKINNTIEKGEQVLLFINKRGYTNFIRCINCGDIYKCENCDISLNYHKNDNTLKCHFCGFQKKINFIKKCCTSPDLVAGSVGIQKIEEYIKNNVPLAKITRMDMDTTRKKGSYEKLLTDFKKGKSNILLGTQMISKGLDFPNITLVGILSLETIISIPSFKSNEKLFQLLVQTSGRAGRSDKEGEVIIQSNINSDIINFAIKNNYTEFYNYEIDRREILNYPPYSNISFITIKGKDERKTNFATLVIFNFLKEHFSKDSILGPNKSIFYKINNEYIFNIVIRFNETNYKVLHKLLKYINNYFLNVYLKDNISITIDNNPEEYI